jgi:2,4-dienoyl-CoA reductase-like NADH-dependent reductase (Old Yellow Enzyme family)
VSERRAIVQVKQLKSVDAVRARLAELGVDVGIDDDVDPAGPLARSLAIGGRTVGNRFAILPMEGWDGTTDGRPTELVERRWRRFGRSGAKLIWGGEAAAVRRDGRANPHQLVVDATTVDELGRLRELLVDEHQATFGRTDDLLVGLQLTHSGRFARPDGEPAPVLAYHHPVLDRMVAGAADAHVLSDDELDELAGVFVDAARLARDAGFDFVDVKHCHGYLLHELLSAVERPGRHGGDLDGRTTFVRTVLEGIRTSVPDLLLGVRLSVFDLTPFAAADGPGRPTTDGPYPYAFGGDGTGIGVDLAEPIELVGRLRALGVSMLCTTAGSPYYNPHVQRPAFFPPSDGYAPPEDPLVGVARQLDATAALKQAHPDVPIVGSAYSYLQDWVAHVGQHEIATGRVDVVGLGRMALSYPDLPADVLAGRPVDRRRICRTFSDCTTAPRNGLVSGCFPLDPAYKSHPDRLALASVKRRARNAGVSARNPGR